MHGAPSVSYPVGRSSWAGRAIFIAWLLGTMGVAAWRWQVPAAANLSVVAVIAVAGFGAAACAGWWRSPQGVIAWGGEDWTWSSGAAEECGTPEAVLDVQSALLLRWQSAGRTRWLWIERRSQPARWDDLRRAVYSRARPEALRGVQPEGDPRT